MLRGIHHPSITTGDLERALAFYRDLLGFQEVFSFGWDAGSDMAAFAGTITAIPDSTARSVLLKAGNAFLEIFEYRMPVLNPEGDRSLARRGYSHVCFDSDDVIADHARLAAAGVPFNAAPIDVGPMRLCYCRDPDGNFVELQQITDPASNLALTTAQG